MLNEGLTHLKEMVLSEITMARLNFCNLLVHFSHSGVDDMADNTCVSIVSNWIMNLMISFLAFRN